MSIAELAISTVLAVAFSAAFITALDWPAQSAIFPLTVSGLGAMLSVGFLARAILRPPVPLNTPLESAAGQTGVGDASDDDDEHAQDDSLEYVFASASAAQWTAVLGFLAGFFLLLPLLGLYIAAGAFTLAYLRYQAGSSWKFSAIYAVVLVATLYGIFGMALRVPLPSGLIF